MSNRLKAVALAVAFVSGCLVFGIAEAEAMSRMQLGITLYGDPYALCGAGSMSTASGVICR